jgi:molecular chaperone DnaK
MLGIDLGTTFSAVASLDDRGRAFTISNEDGDVLTPSAVHLSDDGAVVGQAALNQALETPGDVAVLIKRRMGYADFGRLVHGRDFRPETLAALILKKLVHDASRQIGEVGRVVVTVPAYFDDTRRKATQDAGRIAGLENVAIFDEPCAAALSFAALAGIEFFGERHVLVYDLGGGTFDVSVVRLARKRFQTIAIEGDVQLGGHDWDARIVDHVASAFATKYDHDPRTDPKSSSQLFAAAERAKRTLSKLAKTTVTCVHAGRTLEVPLTRAEFEKMTRDLLTRTRLTVQQVMKQANVGWDKIDKVLLVGGSTHMPMTREMVRELSGKEPESNLAVSEVVARGAALHCGFLQAREVESAGKKSGDDNVVEIQVNAHSLGVEVRAQNRRINDVIIPKNTQLPSGGTRVYHTVKTGQKSVRVKILQGEAHQAEACIPVGECWIHELPASLPNHSPVEVTCRCADDGIISVTAKDKTSGKAVRADLKRTGGLTDEQIEAERLWVESIKVS